MGIELLAVLMIAAPMFFPNPLGFWFGFWMCLIIITFLAEDSKDLDKS